MTLPLQANPRDLYVLLEPLKAMDAVAHQALLNILTEQEADKKIKALRAALLTLLEQRRRSARQAVLIHAVLIKLAHAYPRNANASLHTKRLILPTPTPKIPSDTSRYRMDICIPKMTCCWTI